MAAKGHERVHKSAVGYVVNADKADGVVEAIVNVFGILDTQGDIVHPGAYTKTLKERSQQVRVKILDNHRTSSVLDIVAKALDIHEVGRAQLPAEVREQYPEATGGLYAKMQFMLDDPASLGVFKRINFEASNEYSIGLDIMDSDYSVVKLADGRQVRARNIRQLALFDVSPVIWGANEATATTGVKGATSYVNLPLASRGRRWEADSAAERVKEWAGAEEEPNEKYRGAFFWYDPDNAQNFSAYKLGFADVIDGQLMAVPRGIFAAAGVLNWARDGVDIPDGDLESVKGLVEKYYGKMSREFDDDSIVVPWQPEAETELGDGKDMNANSGAAGGALLPNQDPSAAERAKENAGKTPRVRLRHHAEKSGEMQTLGSWFVGAMLGQTNDCAEDMLSDGCVDLDGYKAIADALMAGLKAFQAALPEEIASMPYPEVSYDDMFAWWARENPDAAKRGVAPDSAKEGRKLSSSTKSALNEIHTKALGAANDLRRLLDETDVEVDPEFENADETGKGKQRSQAEPDTRPLTTDLSAARAALTELEQVKFA